MFTWLLGKRLGLGAGVVHGADRAIVLVAVGVGVLGWSTVTCVHLQERKDNEQTRVSLVTLDSEHFSQRGSEVNLDCDHLWIRSLILLKETETNK